MAQTKRVVSNITDYYGLNSTYNAARLMQAVNNKNQTVLTLFETALGLETVTPESIFTTLRYLTQSWIFGGAFAMTSAQDLLFGFETPVTDMINGGDFFSGNDYRIGNTTTPILNDQIGTVSDALYGVYTGSNLLN